MTARKVHHSSRATIHLGFAIYWHCVYFLVSLSLKMGKTMEERGGGGGGSEITRKRRRCNGFLGGGGKEEPLREREMH